MVIMMMKMNMFNKIKTMIMLKRSYGGTEEEEECGDDK
jgi:hypothetical protein